MEAMGAMSMLPICDRSFTCEDYNTYRAPPWSPFPLRRAHPGPGPHTRSALPCRVDFIASSISTKRDFGDLRSNLVEILDAMRFVEGKREFITSRRRECTRVLRKVEVRLPGKGNSKLPWREAGPLHHPDDIIDSDQ